MAEVPTKLAMVRPTGETLFFAFIRDDFGSQGGKGSGVKVEVSKQLVVG